MFPYPVYESICEPTSSYTLSYYSVYITIMKTYNEIAKIEVYLINNTINEFSY